MVRIDGSIVVDRPVEEVFDFVADQRNEPSYNPGMTECRLLTGEPVGLGSRFSSTMHSRFRDLRMVSEVTGYDRPRRLASRSETAGTVVTGGLTFEPVGTSTRMSWAWQLQPTGAMRVLTPLLAVMGGRMERGIWTGLKQTLEQGAAPR